MSSPTAAGWSSSRRCITGLEHSQYHCCLGLLQHPRNAGHAVFTTSNHKEVLPQGAICHFQLLHADSGRQSASRAEPYWLTSASYAMPEIITAGSLPALLPFHISAHHHHHLPLLLLLGCSAPVPHHCLASVQSMTNRRNSPSASLNVKQPPQRPHSSSSTCQLPSSASGTSGQRHRLPLSPQQQQHTARPGPASSPQESSEGHPPHRQHTTWACPQYSPAAAWHGPLAFSPCYRAANLQPWSSARLTARGAQPLRLATVGYSSHQGHLSRGNLSRQHHHQGEVRTGAPPAPACLGEVAERQPHLPRVEAIVGTQQQHSLNCFHQLQLLTSADVSM